MVLYQRPQAHGQWTGGWYRLVWERMAFSGRILSLFLCPDQDSEMYGKKQAAAGRDRAGRQEDLVSNWVGLRRAGKNCHMLETVERKERRLKDMTKEEYLVRKLVGRGKAGRLDSRIFAYAVFLAREKMFREKVPMEEIHVTKSIYPEAGKRYGKSAASAARQIERLGNRCWEAMTPMEREKYLGEKDRFPAPKEMILLLGCYCEYGKSYREMEREWYGD